MTEYSAGDAVYVVKERGVIKLATVFTESGTVVAVEFSGPDNERGIYHKNKVYHERTDAMEADV